MRRPPRLPDWFLRRCLPSDAVGESILGDLYHEWSLRSRTRAYPWFWWQAVTVGSGYVWSRWFGRNRAAAGPPARAGSGMGRDIRHAARLWRKRPGFTALSVLTLGIGIGTTTAIVSVIDRVLYRSLAFPDAYQLVTVWNTYPTWRGHEVLDRFWDTIHLSFPEYVDWRDGQSTFQSVAIYSTGSSTLTGLGDAALIPFGTASASLFPTLGVRPMLGRTFRPDEEGAGGRRVAVISHGFWARRFGSAPDVTERTVTIDGESYEIIGVLPPDFALRAFTSGRSDTEVWVPAGIFGGANDRGHHRYEAIGRLQPGVTFEQASADIDPLLRGDTPPERMGSRVLSRRDEELAANRGPLLLLLGAAGLLMTIAAVNVATLYTAEAANRRHELATRGALGASRFRLVRQLLVESGSLGLAGAVIGVAVALAGIRVLLRLAPPDLALPALVAIDWRVLSFAAMLGIGTGLAFGVGPALTATRGSVGAVLSRRGTAGSRGGDRVQRAMVTVEAALCVVLLVAAALLGRSLLATEKVDPGFRTDNLVAVSLPLSGPRTQPERINQFARVLVERVGAVPGVDLVTGANAIPFSGGGGSSSFEIEGRPTAAGDKLPEAHRRSVLPGFHRVLGIPVIAGRTITEVDAAQANPVVVVSETMAQRFWPGESPIGSFVLRDRRRWEVIGIVGDVLHGDLTGARESTYYFPFYQQPPTRFWLLVASTLPPGDLIPGVRQAVAETAPDVALGTVESLAALIRRSTAAARYRTVLVAAFGVCSLGLAAVGMFGVTARTVASRRRELGIRIALGAGAPRIMGTVLAKETTALLTGVVIGLGLAALAARSIAGFLFAVSPFDPIAFVGAAVVLALVGGVASYLPARRTAAVEPAEVLQA